MRVTFDVLFDTQKHVIKLLDNSYKKGRLVHTYLFEGAKGTPKLEAAYYLAALLLCASVEKPCLKCPECRKIINGTHRNVILVSPDNNAIKKEQTDNLGKEFSLKPVDEKNRIFIIRDIDRATMSAANSLLKFLEETGPGNYGVLITENLYNVIPTIRSRAQIVSFRQLPPRAIADKLISLGIEEETSYILAHITNSVDECLEMINEGKILDLIDLVKKIVNNIITKEKSPLLTIHEDGKFLLSESDKRFHNIFLDLMIAFLSSLLYLNLKQNEKIIFRNIIHDLESYDDLSPRQIIERIEKILNYKQKLKYNINIDLFYTQMLLAIAV
jgi:DNA polymerase-3 subunit delta'